MTPLAGQTITGLLFDHAVTFLGDAGDELRVETPLTLTTNDGSLTIDPQALTNNAGDLFKLLHEPVSHVIIVDDGTLTITWESGAQIRVEPQSDYEAWTLTSRAGARYVCNPGGNVTTWSAG